jgi:predicted ATPase/class 3 adenylate cyclase
LLARIAEALASAAEPEAAESVLEFAGFRLDLVGHSLRDPRANEVPLTRGEFALLRALAERPGRVLSRNRLMELTAGPAAEAFDRSVDMQILRLRRKIEADPKRPSLIVTVPGSGYKFMAGAREARPAAEPTSERLAEAAPGPAERRHVTALAAELLSPDGGGLPSDPEDLSAVIDEFRGSAAEALAQYGGAIGVARGLEIAAYFGDRQAQESDAERAVRAALAIQRALAETNAKNRGKGAAELLARIGLESGPVVVEATGEVFGDAPNVAARVLALAEPGAVLVTANVQRQVAGLFVAEEQTARSSKGRSQSSMLYRIVRASGGGRRSRTRTLSPLVGRAEELDLLMQRWKRARSGQGRFVQIVGEPGIGKSRLVEEFRARLSKIPHTWAQLSSSQLLQNTPLHPITEWGRARFGDADTSGAQRFADLENTLQLIGIDPAELAPLIAPLVDIPLPPGRVVNLSPEELRRRQLEALIAWFLAGARSQPAALVFEDLHWADPTSLDLIQALAERGHQAPLLILATTRPEFRAPWSLRSHHSVISLAPLDRVGVARMVRKISASHALSRELIEGVNDRTSGVPLFVEEVTRLLLERGEAGGLQAIPPTLQLSLAARLDRLGPAREVAQIGAVLGRDFSYSLVRAVGGVGDPALQSALEKLAEADLLLVDGAGALATYRFKHALIQDAAYDGLLKSRRQALHRRAAETLREEPERAAAQPEVIAHHFTQAGLEHAAIDWWGKAGEQALRRSAFQEATAHLGKAIELADKAAALVSQNEGERAPTSTQRMKLQSDYSRAVSWSKGFAAEETKAAFDRAAELAATSDDFSERFVALNGQWTLAQERGELRKARELASAFCREAENAGRLAEAGVTHRGLAFMSFLAGDFLEARRHCEEALATCNPERNQEARERSGEDTEPVAMAMLAQASWHLGEVDRARELIEEANRRATELGHVPSLAMPLHLKSLLEIMRGDAAAALTVSKVLEALSSEHGMTILHSRAELTSSWAHGRLHDAKAGAATVQQALTALVKRGDMAEAAFYTGLLAQLEEEAIGIEAALARVDEALGLIHQGEVRFCLSFLHRLRGDLLLKRDPPEPSLAEEAFRVAIAVANEQGARSYGLRASLALATLYQSTRRPAEARAVLSPALQGFAPTPEMAEIGGAQALMERLA